MLIKQAWRSIWRHRRRTLITVSSIALGLAFALFFLALGEGVYSKSIDEVARIQSGHITLEHPNYRDAPAVDLWVENATEVRRGLEGLRNVRLTKAIVLGQGVARSGRGSVGVTVMGMEPSVEEKVSPLASHVIAGRYLDDEDSSLALIGSKLAKRLKLREGKKLVLSTSNAEGDLTEELCRVRGIFEVGSDEVDGYLLLVPLPFARRLYGMPEDSATQIGVLLDKPRAKKRAMAAIRSAVGDSPIAVRPWEEVMPELASYIRVDRGSNLVFQFLLIFLILFTIFNTILMSVLERQREFAVLLALGTPPRKLQHQVLVESTFIAMIGCTVGLLLGGLAGYWTGVRGIDLRSLIEGGMSVSGYAISLVLHPEVTLWMVVGLGGLVFCATLLLTLIPIRRIQRIPIVETLR